MVSKDLAEVKSLDGLEFEGDYRAAGRAALKEILERRMNNWIDACLEEIRGRESAAPDRRNGKACALRQRARISLTGLKSWKNSGPFGRGHCPLERHLLTELGDVALSVPRTRRTSAAQALKKFRRRPAQVDRAILECFVLGCSTRKVAQALAPLPSSTRRKRNRDGQDIQDKNLFLKKIILLILSIHVQKMSCSVTGGRLSHAKNLRHARSAARRFADKWEAGYPKAVASLRQDLESLLEFLNFPQEWRAQLRTTNTIEREFREVRRRTRPMGVFSDRTSVERILFAVFNYENHKQGVAPVLLLTQNS